MPNTNYTYLSTRENCLYVSPSIERLCSLCGTVQTPKMGDGSLMAQLDRLTEAADCRTRTDTFEFRLVPMTPGLQAPLTRSRFVFALRISDVDRAIEQCVPVCRLVSARPMVRAAASGWRFSLDQTPES